MKTKTGLENEYGQNVSLKSVHLEGKLEGLLLTMLVKQRYLNDSDETIEASYTFPAGWGANLMSFSVELNGKRMQAVALAKKKAEKKYEEAIESGDTPVMLEKSPLGLYTANLGNLKPGEDAVIIIEYAQLLRFEKGRVRITVPTVIGERYGDEVSDGHIAPHQTVDTDLLVEYPFTATLDILGQMAQGNIACPSHQVDVEQIEGGTRLRLAKGGLLDRDFIVTVEELKGESFVSASGGSDVSNNIEYASLDSELYDLLQDQGNIELLEESLTRYWFDRGHADLRSVVKASGAISAYERHIRKGELGALRSGEAESVRSPAFRRVVTQIYDYRCAATGVRILLPSGEAMVEAAHIHPFSEAGDDDPRNGLALTPNIHWAMDRNLIAPGPDRVWHVSKVLDKRIPDFQMLTSLEGMPLFLPTELRFSPKEESLAWRLERLRK